MNISVCNHDVINLKQFLHIGTNKIAFSQKSEESNAVMLAWVSYDCSIKEVLDKLPNHKMRTIKGVCEEVDTTYERLSLLCPLTFGVLEYPGRGLSCTHVSVIISNSS